MYKKTASFKNISKALMSICSLFYHILDNFLWMSNVNLISEYIVGDINIRSSKNTFSLMRNLIKLILDIYKLSSLNTLDQQITEEVFGLFESEVKQYKNQLMDNKLVKEMLIIRYKKRICILNIFHTIVRICVLINSLRLSLLGFKLHPIFCSFCNLIQAILSIYKFVEKENKYHFINEKQKTKKSQIIKVDSSAKKKLLFGFSFDMNRNKTLLHKDYFKDYLIDFMEDYPTDYKNIITNKRRDLILSNTDFKLTKM